MNDDEKLKYFDTLFSSGNLVPGIALKWAKDNNIQFQNVGVNDYFDLLLLMAGKSRGKLPGQRITNKQFTDFKKELWDSVEWNPYILRVGQVLRLYNKRFTGNEYVIDALNPLGFDVHNRRMPQYKFKDLDYDSIDKIQRFNL